ncbi:VTT domain-containing protein [Candidatus Nomurabacteria bacterium]|uniref:VTT domain-containing protein n=1 Tax=candidate division WWE3 bacterium TaxID=2053526 RepID=A0A955E0V8_UNCKA|nr:VTT domain-containing protein [candidate division WWE3 bacterium]MCB9824108.1 VTT domain-containing protein [Candidatus Nomurabacteria bacterium]MCB9826921.1 VTT domain-containing protein [Candidatus Nomurabacteria bacterium]MCB9828049.1 VTT domain-containing protein [Candidatus Nomurabacteria bacterium]HXK52785.1 VTT domain-containing protein [bacterium]
MSILDKLTNMLLNVANHVPVGLFTFIASFVEEVIAPIPSPIVMTAAGSIAGAQNKAFIFLFWLAFLGGMGKLIGAAILYVASAKAEDFVLTRFGKFIGVSRSEVEAFGQHFGKGKKDFIVIMFSRLIPIVPTAPVSILAGLSKLDFKNYMVSSFVGYLGRNMIYLYIGYVGAESYVNGFDSMESIVQLMIALVLGVIVLFYFYKRKKKGSASFLSKFSGVGKESATKDSSKK